jgi:hypothetical protein
MDKEMTEQPQAPETPDEAMILPKPGFLLPDFCDQFGGKCRGVLVPYAAEVLLIVQMGSLALAAEYFSAKFGRKISTKPVRDILAKIQAGTIPVSEEEIRQTAKLHPLAERFLAKAPWAINPQKAAKESLAPAHPAQKKRGRPRKDAAASTTIPDQDPAPTTTPEDKKAAALAKIRELRAGSQTEEDGQAGQTEGMPPEMAKKYEALAKLKASRAARLNKHAEAAA